MMYGWDPCCSLDENLNTLVDTIKFKMESCSDVATALSECAISAIYAAYNYHLENTPGAKPEELFANIEKDLFWSLFSSIGRYDRASYIRITDYDYLLNPFSEKLFEKSIPPTVWVALQLQAKQALKHAEENNVTIARSVKEHIESIIDGKLPFGFTLDEEEYE